MFANDEIRDTRDERRTKRTAFLSILRDVLSEGYSEFNGAKQLRGAVP